MEQVQARSLRETGSTDRPWTEQVFIGTDSASER